MNAGASAAGVKRAPPRAPGGSEAKKAKVDARACACGCTKLANMGRAFTESEFFQLPPKGTKADSSDKELCETIMGFIVPVTAEKPMWRDNISKPVQKNIDAMGGESSRKSLCAAREAPSTRKA